MTLQLPQYDSKRINWRQRVVGGSDGEHLITCVCTLRLHPLHFGHKYTVHSQLHMKNKAMRTVDLLQKMFYFLTSRPCMTYVCFPSIGLSQRLLRKGRRKWWKEGGVAHINLKEESFDCETTKFIIYISRCLWLAFT